MRIRLVGSREARTAFARVNAHWARSLAARGHTVVTARDGTPVDAVIVHDYERPVGPLRPDESSPGARRVLVRTWDFGPYPRRWCEVVTASYDELWVHSRWNRELAVRGGVPPEVVHVVPLGVDPTVLHPDGPEMAAQGAAATTFLWVGATVRRKGFDVLQAAYRRAFSSDDDVRLIVKDNPFDVFYEGQHVEHLEAMPGAPPVTYVDEELDDETLARLYRSADALVLPFRAEGFALPTLEAMACGTPAVVSRFGPVLDHCDEATAWFVPVRRVHLPVDRVMTYNSLGYQERVQEVDLCEPRREGLVEALRQVAACPPAERAAKGAAAAQVAAARSWDSVAARVEQLLAS